VYDIRHNFVANWVYELPFGSGKPFLNTGGVVDWIVGGWSLSSIGLWHTGHPLTIAMNINASQLPDGNDQTNQRPDLVPGVPVLLAGGAPNHTLQINPAAFAPPPLDPGGAVSQIVYNPDGSVNYYICPLSCGLVSRFGTAPNGVIRALASWQVDFALTKETKLTERVSMQFGVQAFNIFNHVQLGDPSGDNLTFNYGLTATALPSGQIQTTQSLSPKQNLGQINTTNNFNNNNDNAASPNTGTGLPRQIQFMLRFKF
jgi:hypothetical protein